MEKLENLKKEFEKCKNTIEYQKNRLKEKDEEIQTVKDKFNGLNSFYDYYVLCELINLKYGDMDNFLQEYVERKCSKECCYKDCDGQYDGKGFCTGKKKHKISLPEPKLYMYTFLEQF